MALVMEEHGWLDDRRGASALKRNKLLAAERAACEHGFPH
jgi:hypothetical protein